MRGQTRSSPKAIRPPTSTRDGHGSGHASCGRSALLIILDPASAHGVSLFAGVCMGLALGILPGIGGVAGTALLLPFTYNMDAHAAFALLLGLGATTTTADPISAILFGAPGHAASAATTLDGYPMTQARRGRPRARRLLHVGADRRPVRRRPDGDRAADPAADHSVHRLARTARARGVRHFDGVGRCPATRRCAASPPPASA